MLRHTPQRVPALPQISAPPLTRAGAGATVVAVIAASLSVVVSAVFAGAMGLRYARRRRPHQLAWAAGLAMFALAALAGVLARSGGATETEYCVFYLFGAILNVAWLALGTGYLLAPRVARWALWAAMWPLTVEGRSCRRQLSRRSLSRRPCCWCVGFNPSGLTLRQVPAGSLRGRSSPARSGSCQFTATTTFAPACLFI